MKKIILCALVIALLSRCGTTTGSYGIALIAQGTKPGSLAAILNAFESFSSLSRASVSITATNKDGSSGGTLTLTDARLALKEIRFKRAGESAGDIKYQGPYIIDLLSDTVSPAFETIQLPSGTYTEFEMKLAKVEEGISESDDIFGKSIYLEGTYSGVTGNSGTVTDVPFTLAFEIDEEFELTAGSEGFDVSTNNLQTVIVAFRMARWLAFNSSVNDKEEDLSDVLISSGRIDLSDDSPTTNKNIWEGIRKLVKASADFGNDTDGNGKLESGEDDDEDSEDGSDD